MPHYKNGVPANVGDLVTCQPSYANAPKSVGIIIQITPGSSSCNAHLVPVAKRWSSEWHAYQTPYVECVTLSDCLLLVEDQMAQKAEAAAVSAPAS